MVLNCCANNYLTTMPDITIYMNCDTRLAINLSLFDLGDYDEFIFAIKNFNYTDSSYAFLFRATKADMDENGEVIFNIDPDASKRIKQGAFYNFSMLVNAFNSKALTEYKKLTENGKVIIEYGAQDLAVPATEEPTSLFNEILGAQLEEVDELSGSQASGALVNIRVEPCIDEEV